MQSKSRTMENLLVYSYYIAIYFVKFHLLSVGSSGFLVSDLPPGTNNVEIEASVVGSPEIKSVVMAPLEITGSGTPVDIHAYKNDKKLKFKW